MAELLIKAINATNPDPIKDLRGCYKRGDIVVVMPDGHEWGKEEKLPMFVVIKVPNLDVEMAKKYIEQDIDNTDIENSIVIKRRKWQVLVDNIPTALRNELKEKGVISLTWSQIKNYLIDKNTGFTV